ncbi:MAG: hypothetical protein HYS05_08135, partial [Acidobacteria bacterium]|nr:hypothetical protein [Acidobacteriota bacterium]
MKVSRVVTAISSALVLSWMGGMVSIAQTPAGSPAPVASQGAKAEEDTGGLPVTSDLVQQKCGAC